MSTSALCVQSMLHVPDAVSAVLYNRLWYGHASRLSDIAFVMTVTAAMANARSIVQEVCRILAPGGVFIVVSYEPPAGRLDILQIGDVCWGIEVAGEEDEQGNYIYICRKPEAGGAAVAHSSGGIISGGLEDLD